MIILLKALFLYIPSFGLAWVGICSVMFALSHWSFKGAFLPLISGLVILLIASRLLLALVRVYLPPKNKRQLGLINYPE